MSAALDLLRSKDHIQKSYISDIWAPFLGGFLGVVSACAVRYGASRPLMSGIQLHAMLGTLFSGGFLLIDKKRNSWYAERDAMLCHYIELHPEDFPDPERKKYGELFLPWIPVR